MTECAFESHILEKSTTGGGTSSQSAAMRCRRCRVGYLLEFSENRDRSISVEFYIFAAPGARNVDQQMIMFSMMIYQSTVGDMRADGRVVREGTPTIGGPPPPAMAKHKSFRSMSGQ